MVGGLLALVLTTRARTAPCLIALSRCSCWPISACRCAWPSRSIGRLEHLHHARVDDPDRTFIYGIGRLDSIARHLQTDQIVWSPAALGILAGELAVILIAILIAGWVHARKPSFL